MGIIGVVVVVVFVDIVWFLLVFVGIGNICICCVGVVLWVGICCDGVLGECFFMFEV